MRTLRALGLVTLGVIVGASAVTLGSATAAQGTQVSSAEELNARFVVGPHERAYHSPKNPTYFRFLKDKRTGDCYLTQSANESALGEVVKTDDDACSGF